MSEAFRILNQGDAPILIVSDHASNHVPDDIDLGIEPMLLDQHIAFDIGAAQVSAMLAERLGCTAILGGISRLVIDLNREEDAPGLLVTASDGNAVPGNRSASVEARLNRFHRPYHREIERLLTDLDRPFILSVHSFTPRLATDPAHQRPWEIGVLYNEDDQAARIAIPLLESAGFIVGDQLPYSGRQLNYTMNRHAEANGIPYLGLELRQDIAGRTEGQARYANILAPIVAQCRALLA
ncbi:MAG: N-formylglutamate amidohydrolase [Sphingobium sp.]|nr:N-formylglutamate amidohydrolase [Sphingobium sp.]MBP6111449.1 N-formylglutamate amidohydrolase [Sphingobium sp.]MBP8670139.1 N-formylglutamate amidohydrolase [Sphingobium sp.]MBP9157356.1 N-formylglutamate amidohydrolase [Sphingobium sp.]